MHIYVCGYVYVYIPTRFVKSSKLVKDSTPGVLNGDFLTERIERSADTRWKALCLTFPTHHQSRAGNFIKWVIFGGEWWWGVDIWDISLDISTPFPPQGGGGGGLGGRGWMGSPNWTPFGPPKAVGHGGVVHGGPCVWVVSAPFDPFFVPSPPP
jgi:hypothetical protein